MKSIIRILKSLLLLVLLLFVLSGCKKHSDIPDYLYNTPQSYDDGIETTSLNSVGMDSLQVIAMMNYLNSNDGHNIHNILIIKDKKLVFEEYFEGYALDMNAHGRNGALMEYNKDTDQFMFIIPGLEMIVVINSGNYENRGSVSAFNLLKDYILKAL